MIDPLAAPQAADIVAVANGQLMIGRTRRLLTRVTAETVMGARISRAGPLGHASLLAASVMDAFIAASCWQPLSGGVMIAAAHARRLYVLTDEQVIREEAEWTVEVSELRAQAGLHVVGAHRGS